MELIYKNNYGASYRVINSPNQACEMQMVVDTIALFMSKDDLIHLLNIVLKSHEHCTCLECGSSRDKIWCTSPLIDVHLKVDKPILTKTEDLIRGTLFTLNMNATLEENSLIAKDS